jgi:hypothetical protein
VQRVGVTDDEPVAAGAELLGEGDTGLASGAPRASGHVAERQGDMAAANAPDVQGDGEWTAHVSGAYPPLTSTARASWAVTVTVVVLVAVGSGSGSGMGSGCWAVVTLTAVHSTLNVMV